MKFEFDPAKSQANLVKHGIDFVAGQAIWSDADVIRDVPEAVRQGEAYWKAIGSAQGQVWSAIYCYRAGAVRIVSIRKAREDERAEYEILKG
jgi:uncharacterized DUF497 family protein